MTPPPERRSEMERRRREHHQVVRSEPVSFGFKDGRIIQKGTPEYDRLLAEARAAEQERRA